MVARCQKSRFAIIGDSIGAMNGHRMCLPELSIPEYEEMRSTNKRCLVPEKYSKYLPAILESSLNKMGRNNIHLGMVTGMARLQQNRKLNISIYIDLTKAKKHGLHFLHCANDVVLCPGNQMGVNDLYFFHEIRNTSTGDLIEFIKPMAIDLGKEHIQPDNYEVSLPPSGGAAGFAQTPNQKSYTLLKELKNSKLKKDF